MPVHGSANQSGLTVDAFDYMVRQPDPPKTIPLIPPDSGMSTPLTGLVQVQPGQSRVGLSGSGHMEDLVLVQWSTRTQR